MKFHIRTTGCTLSPADQRVLERRIKKLDQKLKHVDPDLVHLEVGIDRHPRRPEYESSIRLVIMNRVLPAGRNTADQMRKLIGEAFDDLDRQLERFTAELRREPARRRTRLAEPPVRAGVTD